MRDNREKWQFYNHPSKPRLTAPEVRYWRESLRRLLKVGIEFEFNLQELKGSCKGDNVQCPCLHIDDGCWQECSITESCQKDKNIDTCANKGPKCKPEKCEKCEDFKFKCIGVTCVDFVSACLTCESFEKNCDTCPKKYDPNKDPKQIRQTLQNEMQPSRTYGQVSHSGVVAITTDGSLAGDKGVEIITVGRRVDYWEFYNMSKKIIDRVVELGGYINERTGTHMHVLTSYYNEGGGKINEMEKPMPQIIVANFHQLCRRYQNALTWMTMALDDPNHMTRWEKFRVSILDISPVLQDMHRVVQAIAANSGGSDGGKYGFVNYNKCRFQGNDIENFHVEFRQADATLCPSWHAALACLQYALAIKAVEISRYGLLKIGDESWLKEAKRMKSIILNNCPSDWSDNRVGDTKKVLDNAEYFINDSLDLVNQLKNILLKMGPAYDILVKIAERPAALRRIDGRSWEEIEKELAVKATKADKIDRKLGEVVDLRLIDDCKDPEEWIREVARCIREDVDRDVDIDEDIIQKYIDAKMREGDMIWSESIGCMLSI
jgi:hypothetical protein